jgi:hypothetical protein
MPNWPGLSLAGLLLLATTESVLAQERQIGLKVGASVATLTSDQTETGQDPFRRRTGLTAGAFAVQPLTGRLALQLELLFTEKGGSVPLHDPSIVQGSLTTRYKLHYMDVPVLVRVQGPSIKTGRLSIFAGPTVSLRLGAKQQTVFELPVPAGFERELGDEAGRVDAGLSVGGGVQFGRVLFDARYTWGFLDALVVGGGTTLNNSGLLLTGGVRIF